MQISCTNLPWPLDKRLIKILNDALLSADVDIEDGVTVTFRDQDFTPEAGGFHPVELLVNKDGQIQYVTDFCYVGQPPMCDLTKCLDFDFSMGIFQSYGMEHPISAGHEMFKIFESNFIAYHEMQAYQVFVEPW